MARLILPARILLCVVLALITLEGLARLDDHVREGAPWFGPFDTSLLFSRDEFGAALRPNSHFSRWKINGSGYRGPEPRTGTIRIICLGSSETFGIAEDENREYPRQLEDQLNQRFGTRSIEVINLGVPGGLFHELPARIPQIVARYHPDLVTIYPSPAQYILLGILAQQAMFNRSQASTPPPKSTLRSRIQGTLYRWVKRWMPAETFAAWRYLRGLRFGLDSLRITGKIDGLAARVFPPGVVAQWRDWSADLEVRRQGWPLMDRLPEETFDLFRHDLTGIVESLEERKIPVVLATHAVRFGESVAPDERNELVEWRSIYPPLKEGGFLDMNRRFDQVIDEVAHDEGAKVVDGARAVPPGPRYFSDFVHFTNQGAEKMASLFAEALAPLVEESLRNRPEPGRSPENAKNPARGLSPAN